MFDAKFLAEMGLAVLKDSHRDAACLASEALNHAMRLGLSDGYIQAMELANLAIAVRDAIAQRIALQELEVGKLVAANLTASDDQHSKTIH